MTEPSPTPQTAPDPAPAPRPSAGATPGAINPGPVQYKGAPLDSDRGPGLGCFRFQLVVLVGLIVLTPLSVGRVPVIVSAILLFATIVLLLVSGQTIIFLLRLVSADRRGRRQPLAARSPTVGQLEDAASDGSGAAGSPSAAGSPDDVGSSTGDGPSAAVATEGAASSDPPVDPVPPATGPVRQ